VDAARDLALREQLRNLDDLSMPVQLGVITLPLCVLRWEGLTR